MAQKREQLKTKMPMESERAVVLNELNELSQKIGLKDVLFSPLPVQDKGMYIINSIGISGKGTFLQFLILFENIQGSKRFFNIDIGHSLLGIIFELPFYR